MEPPVKRERKLRVVRPEEKKLPTYGELAEDLEEKIAERKVNKMIEARRAEVPKKKEPKLRLVTPPPAETWEPKPTAKKAKADLEKEMGLGTWNSKKTGAEMLRETERNLNSDEEYSSEEEKEHNAPWNPKPSSQEALMDLGYKKRKGEWNPKPTPQEAMEDLVTEGVDKDLLAAQNEVMRAAKADEKIKTVRTNQYVGKEKGYSSLDKLFDEAFGNLSFTVRQLKDTIIEERNSRKLNQGIFKRIKGWFTGGEGGPLAKLNKMVEELHQATEKSPQDIWEMIQAYNPEK